MQEGERRFRIIHPAGKQGHAAASAVAVPALVGHVMPGLFERVEQVVAGQQIERRILSLNAEGVQAAFIWG